MRPFLQFRPLAITLFVALSVSYVLCIDGDLATGRPLTWLGHPGVGSQRRQ
jgi:hypothetical protein